MLQQKLGMDEIATRQVLWDTYEPYSMWLIFGLIGTGSLVALVIYNRVVSAADADPNHSFNTRGDLWVKVFLVPICLIMAVASCFFPSAGLILNTLFFWMMLALSLGRFSPKNS